MKSLYPFACNDDVKRTFGVETAPCPFCHGEPRLHMGPTAFVHCSRCDAGGPPLEGKRRSGDPDLDRRQAIALWNRRSKPEDVPRRMFP